MYRDDREALLHRITVLEGEVAELADLRKRCAEMEAELAVLRPPPPPPPPPPIAPGTRVLQLRIEGPGVNRILQFDQDIVKVGRMKSMHVAIEDAAMSRMHSVIERQADGFDIIDLGSTSGTLVNDKRVTKARLKQGDVIRYGAFRLHVL
jgi:hypothetical protein